MGIVFKASIVSILQRFVILLGVFLTLPTFAAPPLDSTETFIVSPAQPSFAIALSANPTTGYIWVLKSMDNKVVTLVSHQYTASKPRFMGSGGQDIWQFRLNVNHTKLPKSTSLQFVYWRPWEKVVVREANYHIEIKLHP